MLLIPYIFTLTAWEKTMTKTIQKPLEVLIYCRLLSSYFCPNILILSCDPVPLNVLFWAKRANRLFLGFRFLNPLGLAYVLCFCGGTPSYETKMILKVVFDQLF
jgi:hypothetical protein